MRSLLIMLSLTMLFSCSEAKVRKADTAPDHTAWTKLLKKLVNENGDVDYLGFMAHKAELQAYLQTLSDHHPDPDKWTEEEQLAYWINAYNAFTVELIIDNYPLESIKDIKRWNIPFLNTPWTIKFIKLGGKKYNLDAIEHKILRKQFNEPRIHFAIVCASISCPRLLNEAYTADRLNEQLDLQARHFINTLSKNRISADKLELSKLFSWFSGDFTENGTLIEYLNKYADVQINPDAEISYLDYNWKLNIGQ